MALAGAATGLGALKNISIFQWIKDSAALARNWHCHV